MVGKEAYMELTQADLEVINTLLPARYIIEINDKPETITKELKEKRSEKRKLSSEVSLQYHSSEKRLRRERKTVAYEEIDSGFRTSEGYKKLMRILQTIKKHPLSEPFLQAVNSQDYPDYYRQIENPMDLARIELKLKSGEYESSYDFAMDMRQVWSNSFRYNDNSSEIFENTIELSGIFENLIKGSEFLILGDKKNLVQDLYRKIDKLTKVYKDIQSKGTSIKVQVKTEKPMSFIEKKTLCQAIKSLEAKYLKGMLDIVKECMDIQGEELEFDIDKLPPRVCRELDAYVKSCLQTANNKKKVVSVEGTKNGNEASLSKIKELDSQLEQLVKQTRTENVEKQEKSSRESDSESSSSDSEEEEFEEVNENKEDLWKHGKFDDNSDQSNGYGSILDFDKIY